MFERRHAFSLYSQVTRSTPTGLVETTPDDPEAQITVSVVAEGEHEYQVRNATDGLETLVEVREISSLVNNGDRFVPGTIAQIPLHVPQSALHRIRKSAEGPFVKVLLQQGLQAVIDTGPEVPRIIFVDRGRRSR